MIEDDSNTLSEDDSKKDRKASQPAKAQRTSLIQTTNQDSIPGWARIVAAVVIVAAIIFGLVMGARAIYHATHNNPPTVAVGTSNSNSSNPNKAAGGTNSGPQSNEQAGGKGTSNSSNLPNSGPGDVLAIFASAVLAGAGAHYVWSVKLSKNNLPNSH